jgi:hypothetical protein
VRSQRIDVKRVLLLSSPNGARWIWNATVGRAIHDGGLVITPEGKYVAALSHYQTNLRDTPPSFDNDRSAAR